VKISVVTVSYNQARFLRCCIESILSQEGVDIEYIVVDACSTDGSQEILERYRTELSHLIIEKDKGAADGLNKGFARATGDIFYYLNSDDVVLRGAFARAAEVFERHPGIDGVYGDGVVVNAEGRAVRRVVSSPIFSPYRYLAGATVLLQQATFFRPSIFHRVGGFNVANKACWDGELMLDMAIAGARFKHVSEPWGAFRLHAEGISGSGRMAVEYARERARMFRTAYGRDREWRDDLSRFFLRAADKAMGLLRY
jgi:glycosyltransferase involved in cell wall biosynthesis